MKTALLTVASLSALSFTASPAAAQMASIPVTFGPPSTLEIGQPPLPSDVEFDLAWPYADIASPITDNVRVTCQPGFIDPSDSARIVPSTNGHAVNSKGTGANRMTLEFSPVTGSPVLDIMHDGVLVLASSSNVHATQHEIAMWEDLDGDGVPELSLQRLLLDLEITVFQGLEFTAEPQFTVLSDGRLEIFAPLTIPSGVTLDPNQDVTSYRFSASVVPTPGAATLATIAGLAALRRRRPSPLTN
jgi:MYXO-CTERM domain-containing protein